MKEVNEQTRWVDLCKQIHISMQLPVYYRMDGASHGELLWSSEYTHPLFSGANELFSAVIAQDTNLKYPIVRVTDFREQFIILPIYRDGRRQGGAIIGPMIQERPDSDVLAKLINDYGVSFQEKARWNRYWRSLPVVNRFRLLHICVLAHWVINHEALDVKDIFESSLQYDLPNWPKDYVEKELADRREFSLSHMGVDKEKSLLDLIRRGERSELLQLLAETTYEEAGVLAKRSQLRNLKNLAIGAITLSVRAAIEGGVFEERAYTLGDLRIQQIEELNEAKAVEAAMIQTMLDLADLAGQSRKVSFSKPIRNCREYIYNHLFESFSTQQLSEITGLNADYLSQLFKRETGMTLTNYIQKERIGEAKKLLDSTGETISAIGSRLSFYDQAHFLKVFKKHVGMTPKQYRNRHSNK
ncbi:helix-turn-helix domain-containing protein [Paenibacillus sp. GM2]|uniref:helix-turn-helix domain-containing protein n=1 Tax=Paenibacillus sp. GM2 TaxID=1622070 RepID=UPI000837F67C|nr:helix-turn-helix domain-containing protein [Paenibacillus sp. GM2]